MPNSYDARAFVDQLERSGELSSSRIAAVRSELARAEGQSGQPRATALRALATQLNGEAGSSRDATKVRKLTAALNDLAR